MSFPLQVREEALVSCGRYCSICHKFCGIKIELHHILPKADGGEDTFENCIPLCFDCHADMSSYDHKHPKGTKYTTEELKKHRNNWYSKVRNSYAANIPANHIQLDTAIYARIMKIIGRPGPIPFLRKHHFGGSFYTRYLEPLHALVFESEDPGFEFLDADLEGLRATLINHTQAFLDTVGEYTFPIHISGSDERVNTLPPEWRHTNRETHRMAETLLNETSTKIVETFDDLVRLARRKLGVE